MDGIFCITIAIIVIRAWWRHGRPTITERQVRQPKADPIKETDEERQRRLDEAALRREGYTDELIATILPVINNDK